MGVVCYVLLQNIEWLLFLLYINVYGLKYGLYPVLLVGVAY